MIIKRPQSENAPKPPCKWVLAGHSMGALAVEMVRDSKSEPIISPSSRAATVALCRVYEEAGAIVRPQH